MRKVIVGVLMMALLLSGCSAGGGQTAVYSFWGGDETFSVSNGVIVFTPEEQILDGGMLHSQQGDLTNLKGYNMELYVSAGGERQILVSFTAVDETGGGITLHEEEQMLSIRGDRTIGTAEQLDGNLYLTLELAWLNGETDSRQIKLETENITAAWRPAA